MYKELKSQLEDKGILEEEIKSLEERIKYKIQKQLGLHATSYSELKINCLVIDDKMAKVFGQIEKLDKRLQVAKGELQIIENTLEKVDYKLQKSNDLEKKVFRCRYILGLSVKQTAERLNYSEDHIKDISGRINKK